MAKTDHWKSNLFFQNIPDKQLIKNGDIVAK